MITTKALKTKINLKYENEGGSYTFSNIDTAASNDDLMSIAEVINSLQEKEAEKVYKVVETQLISD